MNVFSASSLLTGCRSIWNTSRWSARRSESWSQSQDKTVDISVEVKNSVEHKQPGIARLFFVYDEIHRMMSLYVTVTSSIIRSIQPARAAYN